MNSVLEKQSKKLDLDSLLTETHSHLSEGLKSGTGMSIRERAAVLASLGVPQDSQKWQEVVAQNEHKYLVFQIAEQMFGFPLKNVHMIQAMPKYTPIPNADESLIGMASLLGEIIAILDFATLMGMPTNDLHHSKRMIQMRRTELDSECTFAVDSIVGMRVINPEEINRYESVEEDEESSENFFRGTASLPSGEVILIDVDALLDSTRLLSNTSVFGSNK